nr:hypothetical protein [Tanacetum cinerariifolium]
DEISMDFVTGLPRTQRRHDAIWVVVDRLTKPTHFLPIRKDYSVSKLAKTFQQEIVRLHGTPSAIVGERVIEGPEMIEVTNEKVAVAKEKIKEARTRQKSYANKHRRSIEFQPGDRVFLKVSPARGVRRFGIKGKLSPRFIGPFEILDRVVSFGVTSSVVACSQPIVSDRDLRFASRFWKGLQKAWGTRLKFSTAFHPQTDNQTERTIQTLEDIWHASIKCAPFEMLYGRKCHAPIFWDQVGERVIEGPKMIEVTNEKVAEENPSKKSRLGIFLSKEIFEGEMIRIHNAFVHDEVIFDEKSLEVLRKFY